MAACSPRQPRFPALALTPPPASGYTPLPEFPHFVRRERGVVSLVRSPSLPAPEWCWLSACGWERGSQNQTVAGGMAAWLRDREIILANILLTILYQRNIISGMWIACFLMPSIGIACERARRPHLVEKSLVLF